MGLHKYRYKKVKLKHHILKEAAPYIDAIADLSLVRLIVPSAIDNSSHGHNRMKISTPVENGFKLTFGGAGAQKFHILCDPSGENRVRLQEAIDSVTKRR